MSKDKELLVKLLQDSKTELSNGKQNSIVASVAHINDPELKEKMMRKLISDSNKVSIYAYQHKGDGNCPVCHARMGSTILHNNRAAWFCKRCNLASPKIVTSNPYA